MPSKEDSVKSNISYINATSVYFCISRSLNSFGPKCNPCFVQGTLVPQLPPGEGQVSVDSEVPEDAMERLAHLEQLVVQLKELIRDRDTQLMQKDTELTNKDAQHKVNKPFMFVSNQYFLCKSVCIAGVCFALYAQTESEEAEARFTKLKLQAKAKMASLNKQIIELKGQGEAVSLICTNLLFQNVSAWHHLNVLFLFILLCFKLCPLG